MAVAIAAAAAAVIGTGYGIYQSVSANKKLKELEKEEMAKYKITPEQQRSYNRAEENALAGITGAERNAFQQGIRQSQNTAYQNAVRMSGGNMARSLSGGLGASNLNAQNELAAFTANMKRNNQRYADVVGQGLTDQRNRQTMVDQNYRMELERNLGMAKQQGQQNVVNAIQGAAYVYAAYHDPNATRKRTGGSSMAEQMIAQQQNPYTINNTQTQQGSNMLYPTQPVLYNTDANYKD